MMFSFFVQNAKISSCEEEFLQQRLLFDLKFVTFALCLYDVNIMAVMDVNSIIIAAQIMKCYNSAQMQ